MVPELHPLLPPADTLREALAQEDILVFALPVDSSPARNLAAPPLPDPAEQARADAFTDPAARHAFRAGRGLLREVLTCWLPPPIPLELSAHGKPRCPLPGAPEFSLSHGGGWLALALSRCGPVGVDVEDATRPLPLAQIAHRYFSPADQAEVEQGGATAFFNIWTRREALAKAAGRGLAGLGSVNPGDWSFCTHALAPSRPLAICHPPPARRVVLYTYDPALSAFQSSIIAR